ncbi:MAG: hypothetical protein A2504_16080 [Bdellovibrionales bacterium RIFOXYD12_FULL_39_22]|nr:MAG: hypothetical protein A2385_07990 [Bdellovibrionales bacterium RIFOXYB1_FULL_39_21]OFZ43001.1 MAG: hypothetical protein A2485_11235 [Bdellovibrionales bacterium RIFOXYC12_FULL_39_17]OFZ50913.1 MAG: hypothetical protein A2404_06905 [Bdellovibrionales bacterium RIFOXYC1_FULL_39_130]OFZ72964.1 MAG: hypothetical protein A2451_07260 [Bdellovibrionales bacterium RIFOXYC2_FULL_39_8]OFZ78136.1 MAG: hypothetical protein A2560_02075 [Bdellovibrionales bacterium RIFOXYD1_FULL_39_84]OFZ94004.1 MAG:
MKSNFEKLQRLINEQVIGVIWATEEKLVERPFPFQALDYFFDGTLTNFCANCATNERPISNLFCAHNFGHNIFLLHVEKNISSIDANVSQIVDLGNNFAVPGIRDKILIISKDNTNEIAKSISRKLPNLKTVEVLPAEL